MIQHIIDYNKEELDKVKDSLKTLKFNGEMNDNALHVALYHGAPKECIKYLTDHGVDLAEKNCNGMTPIAYAIQQKKMTIAQPLLSSQTVNIIDSLGRNLLHMTTIYGEEAAKEFIPLLIKLGVNLLGSTIHKQNPLHLAAYHNNPQALDALLKSKKLNVDEVDSEGNSPLMVAVKRGSKDAFDRLLKKKKIKLSVQDLEGNSPLHILASEGDKRLDWMLALIKKSSSLLKKCTLDLEIKNGKGETPLICAVKVGKNNLLMIQKLLSLKADKGAKDGQGKTISEIAKEAGMEGVDQLLKN